MQLNPWALLAVVLSTLFSPESAARDPRFGDTLTVMLGGMPNRADGSFSSTLDGRPKRDLAIKDLGLDDRDWVFWGSLDWRFAERWELGLTYSELNVSGLREFQKSGSYEDIEWSAGATLDSSMKLNFYIVDASWDFLRTGKAHLGLGFGLHLADLAVSIDATLAGSVDGQDGVVDLGTASSDVVAPLPNLTLDGGFLPRKDVYVCATLSYFALSSGDYEGELISARTTIEWRPSRRVGIGAGYQYIEVDLDIDRSNRDESYNLELSGPVVFVSIGF